MEYANQEMSGKAIRHVASQYHFLCYKFIYCQPLLYMYLFKTLSTSTVQVITHFPNDNYKKTTITRD